MAHAAELSASALEEKKGHCGQEASATLDGNSGEAQHEKFLQLMRGHLQNAGISGEEINEATLERFLATNAGDPKRASEALANHFKWWHTFAPLGYIPEEEIITERKKAKLCLQGYDKKGRIIGVFPIVRHNAFDRDLEELKRYIVYSLEKAVSISKNRAKEITVIVDLAGWSYKSVDIRGYLALLDILQEHYINHLGKMILIHVPVMFWAAWKVTSPFFNESTRARMLFVEDKELKSVLEHEIDEDQLPDIYGGKMPLQPV